MSRIFYAYNDFDSSYFIQLTVVKTLTQWTPCFYSWIACMLVTASLSNLVPLPNDENVIYYLVAQFRLSRSPTHVTFVIKLTDVSINIHIHIYMCASNGTHPDASCDEKPSVWNASWSILGLHVLCTTACRIERDAVYVVYYEKYKLSRVKRDCLSAIGLAI